MVFIIAGVVRRRWFRLNVIDGILVGYITLSIIATIVNEEAWTLVQAHFQTIVIPYIGWRMLFTSSSKARDVIVPCLVAIGTVVAIAGLYEFPAAPIPSPTSSSTLSWRIGPRLTSGWGRYESSVSFGQPIALGMFLLIPIGLAVAITGRYYLAALLVLLPAEILTLARGSWIGTIVLLLMLLPLILRRAPRSSIVGGLVVLLACGVAFAHPISSVLSSTSQQGSVENASANYRVDLFQTSIERGQLRQPLQRRRIRQQPLRRRRLQRPRVVVRRHAWRDGLVGGAQLVRPRWRDHHGAVARLQARCLDAHRLCGCRPCPDGGAALPRRRSRTMARFYG